jgi:geranylgeranyl diphosphate synthase type II
MKRHLEAQVGFSHTIGRVMEYGLFSGGKRIRPLLTLAAGELFGGKLKVLLPFACAVEMVHAYSLIHDDLPALDDDNLRRGAPTAHKVFGEGMALLAGDALLTEAFHLMSGPKVSRSLPAKLVLELIHELGRAAGLAGLVGGQALDLEAEDRVVDPGTVEYIHVRKTGALILAAVRIGARAARAEGAALRQVSRFGKFLGLGFQIADDLMDFSAQESGTAAQESSRRERKKAAYPSAVGIVPTKARLRELSRQALRQIDSFGKAAEPLRAIARYVFDRALGTNSELRGQEIRTQHDAFN